MKIACLDVEGVLLPEIWINVAKKTGIKELERTTRDEPDYRKLMNQRLDILKNHNLKIQDIQSVIASMDPLEGALDFLRDLRSNMQVILLSDTFEEFAKPLMKKLEWPCLFCNSLVINTEGFLTDFILRQNDGKRKAVEALIQLNMQVYAAGDSYNDLSMIQTAHKGAFFCPPENIVKENPQVPVCRNYKELSAFLKQ